MSSLISPRRRERQRGFTLIELMVVVVVIGILATVGTKYFTAHVLEANVEQALPHLNAITAKNRIHYNRTGYYLGTANEEEIQKKLGVDLSDAGDFCFMIFCTDASICAGYGASPFSSGTPTAGTFGTFVTIPVSDPVVTTVFQVVAVLREKAGTGGTSSNVDGAGETCAPSYLNAPLKDEPTGWVSGDAAGSEGRIVVESYPPPVDGRDASETTIDGRGRNMFWRHGVSITDAVSD